MSRRYGVTDPVSTAEATPEERRLNEALIRELKAQGSFESEAEGKRRVRVLDTMQKLTTEFVYEASLEKNMTEGMARDAGGKIFTFGSYRLGVHGPGSDIDTLVVAPKHVTREQFFSIMDRLLRQRPELEEIAPVPEAFVPIIKIKFDTISIDLIFSRIDVPRVPLDLTLEDNNLLRNIDEKELRALNGTRVTDDILRLVPERTVFKHALRAIKLWAQRRAIYANIMGFPGGVAWAMLVARICQLWPNAVAATIIDRFFLIYSRWNWPHPVLLKHIEDGPLQVRVWNPQIYAADRFHRMPIITPAYPSMCATHNITASTQKVIMAEISRGQEILANIVKGESPWKDLFAKHTFFYDYKYYMLVVAACQGSAEDHLQWSGFVESKLRFLVQKLELIEHIEIAHPFNKCFDQEVRVNSDDEACRIADGGKPREGSIVVADAQTASAEPHLVGATGMEQLNLAAAGGSESPERMVRTTSMFIGIKLSSKAPRTVQLQPPCQIFSETCLAWPQYDEQLYSVSMRMIRPWQLPSQVFSDGEIPPSREKYAVNSALSTPTAKRAKVNGE